MLASCFSNLLPQGNPFKEFLILLLKNQVITKRDEQELKALISTFNNSGPTCYDINRYYFALGDFIKNRLKPQENCYTNVDEGLINVLAYAFSKMKIEDLGMYTFFFEFLINMVFDEKQQNCVKRIDEELQLSVMKCTASLMKSMNWEFQQVLYTKLYVPLFGKMVYVALEIARTEQLRSLRIASLECIMCLAQVHDGADFTDLELYHQVATIFMFYLPGIATTTSNILLEDEKQGHKVAVAAVKTLRRIITMQLQNYGAFDCTEQINHESACASNTSKRKWKNVNEFTEYIKNTCPTPRWNQTTDKSLLPIAKKLEKVVRHSHENVRLELANLCETVAEHCFRTIPLTVSKIVEIAICLSEDDNEIVSKKARDVLEKCFPMLNSVDIISDHVEENFYNAVSSLPKIFNGLDEKHQLVSLNLIFGYIRLFGGNKLSHILHSPPYLEKLTFTLIYVAELERPNAILLEESGVQDFEVTYGNRTPWKEFKHFRDDRVKRKLEQLCRILAEDNVIDILIDVLIEMYRNNEDSRKEITFILNEILAGCNSTENKHLIKSVLEMYFDQDNWNCLFHIGDEEGEERSRSELKNNIIQICLQVEGVSKMAQNLKEEFVPFLVKTLYPVLECAGSGQPLIKAAGISAIKNITLSCGYKNVAELINVNSDYFAFHVVRKIHRAKYNEQVLNVLGAVMRNSSMEVLPSIADIVNGVLVQTCDKFFQEKNSNNYLRVFKIFVQCLIRWMDIKIIVPPIKSRKEKEAEYQEFQVSGIESESNRPEDEGKSAEEMFNEDMEKSKEELEKEINTEVEEYKKPKPPLHVELTVAIVKRSLHFLPSKNKVRKLLVLEILKYGLEILRDWEDELLPLVHHIWSPLVGRFLESNEPVIVNYSFQLLVTMARVSKDFIRSRTVKDVLPHLLKNLDALAKESYLKDRGSVYRYSQAYKLQLMLLEHLSKVIIDLDITEQQIDTCMDTVVPYLSDKQPLPLQNLGENFFKDLHDFDPELVEKKLLPLHAKDEFVRNIDSLLTVCKQKAQ